MLLRCATGPALQLPPDHDEGAVQCLELRQAAALLALHQQCAVWSGVESIAIACCLLEGRGGGAPLSLCLCGDVQEEEETAH